MCAEAPVSMFQLAAAGVESQEEQSGAESEAEAKPALTVAALADCWGVSWVSDDADDALGASEVSCLRCDLLERYCMRWVALSPRLCAGIAFAEALVLRVVGATTERAGELRGDVGEDRDGWRGSGLVFKGNKNVLQLAEGEGVVQEQGMAQRRVFCWQGADNGHEDKLIIELGEGEGGRAKGLHV